MTRQKSRRQRGTPSWVGDSSLNPEYRNIQKYTEMYTNIQKFTEIYRDIESEEERGRERDEQRFTRVRGGLDWTTVGDHCRAADFRVAVTTSVDSTLCLALDVTLYTDDRNKMRR